MLLGVDTNPVHLSYLFRSVLITKLLLGDKAEMGGMFVKKFGKCHVTAHSPLFADSVQFLMYVCMSQACSPLFDYLDYLVD